MIDSSLRNRRIQEEARDPECALILLDVVLGYGSNMDPVRELAGPICEARRIAAEAGRHLIVACSTTGTAEDPQDRTRVENGLRQAGALVFPSNAAASQFAAHVVRRIEAR
jgi:FdrA protein